jgi:hypothetical protein
MSNTTSSPFSVERRTDREYAAKRPNPRDAVVDADTEGDDVRGSARLRVAVLVTDCVAVSVELIVIESRDAVR